jgi:aryl-alcohol dehydrogenase-like predicted oxidoreductase
MTATLRQLGQTGIEVTPIGLGVMQFAGANGFFRFWFPDISQSEMNDIVQAALDGGINWFDTAEMYGRGRSEKGLTSALIELGQQDDEVLVATKWLPMMRTASNIPKTIDDRLGYLQGYTIDLYQIHNPMSFSSPEAEMEAMADLVGAGKIRSVGVSNFSAEQMRRAYVTLEKRGLPLASNQVHFSLLDRGIERNGILKTAQELGVTIIAWSPLSRGILTGKFHRDPRKLKQTPFGRRLMMRRLLDKSKAVVEALEEIALSHEATATKVALSWTIHVHGTSVVAIPGASKARHAQEAAAAMNLELTEEEMARLDTLSKSFR